MFFSLFLGTPLLLWSFSLFLPNVDCQSNDMTGAVLSAFLDNSQTHFTVTLTICLFLALCSELLFFSRIISSMFIL